MHTEFKMYSGTHTIGGVVFTVTYGKDRVVLEMGSAYDPTTDVYDGIVMPRNKNWLADKLRLKGLPAIDGLYSKEDLNGYDGVVAYEDTDYNSAVFISHLHLDHMSNMGTVAKEIPVYLHEKAQIIERALEETGKGIDNNGRNYTSFEPNEWIMVGKIKVLPILCRDRGHYDFAFLVHTPDGAKIHWTGDITLHDSDNSMTLKQMEIVKNDEVDVLLCEATSFMDSVWGKMSSYSDGNPQNIKPCKTPVDGYLTNSQYIDEIYKRIEQVKGLCVFNFYEREMDDVEDCFMWAKKTNRLCVFEPETAYIVYKYHQIKPFVYVPDSRNIKTIKDKDWFKELSQNCTIVTLDQIKSNPSGYFLQNTYPNIMELFSLPTVDAAYIHYAGIPIGEFDPAYKKMLMLVDKAEFEYVNFMYTKYFGHGYPCETKYFVDETNPKMLVPCHSLNPERLLPKDGVQFIPELGQTYIVVPGIGLQKIGG